MDTQSANSNAYPCVDNVSPMLSQLAKGVKDIRYDSAGNLEACSWFPLDFDPCAFYFVSFHSVVNYVVNVTIC